MTALHRVVTTLLWTTSAVFAVLSKVSGDDDSEFLRDSAVSTPSSADPAITTLDNSSLHDTPDFDCPYDDCYYLQNMSHFDNSWSDDAAFVPTVTVYGLALILGLTGNILVVFALAGDRKAHNVTSSFLISLSVADLAFLVVCLPCDVSLKMHTQWAADPWLCKVSAFIEMLTATSSVLNLTAISIERYVVIVHPMKSRSLCTMGNMRKIIIGVWVLAALLSAPLLHTTGSYASMYYNSERAALIVTCLYDDVEPLWQIHLLVWYQLVVMFLLPLIAMLFCYTFVIQVLRRSNKQLEQLTHTKCQPEEEAKQRLTVAGPSKTMPCRPGNDHNADVREARMQVIKMLITIMIIFFICWGPKLILRIFKKLELIKGDGFYVVLIINLLPYIQSCSNPLIYSFMSKNFRRSMNTSCRTRCRVCHRVLYGTQKTSEFDLDTKTNGGGRGGGGGGKYASHSRYSPGVSSSTPGKTLYSTILSDTK